MTAQELIRTEEGTVIDLETGEVIYSQHADRRDILFGSLQPPAFDAHLSKADVLQLGDCIDKAVERIGDIAARAKAFRDQAEKRAKPLEDRVARYLELLKPWAAKLAQEVLPRVKSGKNAGSFAKKTLDCDRASLAFRRAGGGYQYDERELIDWLEANGFQDCVRKQIVEKKTVDIEMFLRLYNANLWPEHPSIIPIPVDEFATMRLELPS